MTGDEHRQGPIDLRLVALTAGAQSTSSSRTTTASQFRRAGRRAVRHALRLRASEPDPTGIPTRPASWRSPWRVSSPPVRSRPASGPATASTRSRRSAGISHRAGRALRRAGARRAGARRGAGPARARRGARPAASAPSLAELVEARLAEQNVAEPTRLSWDAWRADDDRWTVRLSYLAGGRATGGDLVVRPARPGARAGRRRGALAGGRAAAGAGRRRAAGRGPPAVRVPGGAGDGRPRAGARRRGSPDVVAGGTDEVYDREADEAQQHEPVQQVGSAARSRPAPGRCRPGTTSCSAPAAATEPARAAEPLSRSAGRDRPGRVGHPLRPRPGVERRADAGQLERQHGRGPR